MKNTLLYLMCSLLPVFFSTGGAADSLQLSSTPAIGLAIIDFPHRLIDSSEDVVAIPYIPNLSLTARLHPVSSVAFSRFRLFSLSDGKKIQAPPAVDSLLIRHPLSADTFADGSNTERHESTPGATAGHSGIPLRGRTYDVNWFAFHGDTLSPDPRLKIPPAVKKSLNLNLGSPSGPAAPAPSEPDWHRLYNRDIPYDNSTNIMTIPAAVIGLSMVAASSQELDRQFRDQRLTKGTMRWSDIQWDRIIGSGVSSGLSTGYTMMSIYSGSATGSNTVEGLIGRNLATNSIDFGVSLFDGRYSSQNAPVFSPTDLTGSYLSSTLGAMAFAATMGAANRYLLKNSWDPAFGKFSRDINGYNPQASSMQQWHKNLARNRITDDHDPTVALSETTIQSNDESPHLEIIPVIDFGWPIIGTPPEKKNRIDLSPMKESRTEKKQE
ncbi:MAG: hypothetical protein JW795_09410 [Chitinivibrionales bacterium]|nr:hypothetical protein [Chitinivibrionales bacterium]